ncbi:MAG: CopG family transcriptional regulator [Spirochaetaceae bacterium]|jgi:predicted DNA-binding protein|nr:CopG family transcriptional regulator [Spirochaetaceae bacterium]
MTSLRLPVEMEQKISSFAKTRNISKTDLIINALDKFFKEEEEIDSYELGKAYFGKFGSGTYASSDAFVFGESYVSDVAQELTGKCGGQGNRSLNYKEIVKEKIVAKYRSC